MLSHADIGPHAGVAMRSLAHSLRVQAAAPEVLGCIRPGCVFLTLDIGLRLDEHRAAVSAGALSLLDHLTKWCSCWRELRVALQVGNSLAISVVRPLVCSDIRSVMFPQ